jgi:hypothetical protein
MTTQFRLAVLGCALLLAACSSPSGSKAADKEVASAGSRPFTVSGSYLEACSCMPPCECEFTGPEMTCKGIGAYQFDKGTFDGADFSGTRVAYSLYIGKNVKLYVDAPDAAKRAAAEKFAREALKGFGPVSSVRDAKIEITGKDGTYTLKIDGGKTLTCTTEPVLGSDKKAVAREGSHDVLNPTTYQATCTGATYADGDMKITLDKGKNAYFNQHMMASGKL